MWPLEGSIAHPKQFSLEYFEYFRFPSVVLPTFTGFLHLEKVKHNIFISLLYIDTSQLVRASFVTPLPPVWYAKSFSMMKGSKEESHVHVAKLATPTLILALSLTLWLVRTMFKLAHFYEVFKSKHYQNHYTEPEEVFISQKYYIFPTEHLHDVSGSTASRKVMILDA